MESKNYTCSIEVEQNAETIFNAILDVRSWWSNEIKGSTNKLNDEFVFQVSDVHISTQKIIELVQNQKVVWLVTQSQLNFIQDKNEWTGTKICFEILALGNKTQLKFSHIGLLPGIECYDACSNAWTQIIQQSLVSLITTGKGKNIF